MLPRGTMEDLETTLILTDTQYLIWVASQLGKPKAEIIQLCIGKKGVPQVVLVGMEAERQCPWYNYHGVGLWRRCQRPRLTPAGPCQFHDRPHQGAKLSVSEGPVYPYEYNDRIYWTVDEPDAIVFREDGTTETSFQIRFATDNGGERVPYIDKDKDKDKDKGKG
jgi:hypothetical protein